MNADDIIFEPIGSDLEQHFEDLWQFYLDLLPPEINVNKLLQTMDQDEIDLCKQFILNLLKKYDDPPIENSQQLKDILNGTGLQVP